MIEPWGPAPDGVDRPYWDGLLRGELRMQRCRHCDTWIWGPQWICGTCYTFDPEWAQVEPVGTVYSWSRTHRAFIEELDVPVPYITVLVELLAAGDRRTLGILTGDTADEIAIGDPVTGYFTQGSEHSWPMLRWRRDAEVFAA